MEESAWVQMAQAGDGAAFAHLVDVYQGHVFNLAYRMLRHRQDAEDAAQETFLRAYRQLATYRPSERFSTWLLAIDAHLCVDQLRRRRFGWVALDEAPVVGALFSREPDPEQSALAAEDREMVRRLLDRLPAKYRLVTLLRYTYDLSIAEIASVTGASEGAVKTQLCRAREMLAAEMRATGEGALDRRPEPPAVAVSRAGGVRANAV
jgi:RNA polymerase sigma-70 factor, ECF subfamily